jgi:fructokinase
MTGISEELWDKIIACGLQFSANVCKSINNSVDAEFGHKMAKEMKEY